MTPNYREKLYALLRDATLHADGVATCTLIGQLDAADSWRFIAVERLIQEIEARHERSRTQLQRTVDRVLARASKADRREVARRGARKARRRVPGAGSVRESDSAAD